MNKKYRLPSAMIFVELCIFSVLKAFGVYFDNVFLSAVVIILFFSPIFAIFIMLTKEKNVRPIVKILLKTFMIFVTCAFILATVAKLLN